MTARKVKKNIPVAYRTPCKRRRAVSISSPSGIESVRGDNAPFDILAIGA